MKILALETSAAACSAALCQDGTLLAQSWQNSGLTHSRTLLPLVDSMLKNCGASLKEVEVIAVAAGPGSFTGLRIGVATAKGLAWPEDKPCAPCSTLESMAWPLAHLEGRVIVCAMDARRSQVYNALFLAAGEGLQRLTPDRAIGLDQLGEELKKVEKEKIVVGDGARLYFNRAGYHPENGPGASADAERLGCGPRGAGAGPFRRTGLRRGAGPRVLPPVSGGAGAAGAGS